MEYKGIHFGKSEIVELEDFLQVTRYNGNEIIIKVVIHKPIMVLKEGSKVLHIQIINVFFTIKISIC